MVLLNRYPAYPPDEPTRNADLIGVEGRATKMETNYLGGDERI
jgi:hypothetical protein